MTPPRSPGGAARPASATVDELHDLAAKLSQISGDLEEAGQLMAAQFVRQAEEDIDDTIARLEPR